MSGGEEMIRYRMEHGEGKVVKCDIKQRANKSGSGSRDDVTRTFRK